GLDLTEGSRIRAHLFHVGAGVDAHTTHRVIAVVVSGVIVIAGYADDLAYEPFLDSHSTEPFRGPAPHVLRYLDLYASGGHRLAKEVHHLSGLCERGLDEHVDTVLRGHLCDQMVRLAGGRNQHHVEAGAGEEFLQVRVGWSSEEAASSLGGRLGQVANTDQLVPIGERGQCLQVVAASAADADHTDSQAHAWARWGSRLFRCSLSHHGRKAAKTLSEFVIQDSRKTA